MNVYEFLTTHKSALEQINDAQIEVSDVRHLDMYREYVKLIGEGHKKTYVMKYLSDEYSVNERTVYRIIQRMDRKIEL